MAGNTKLVHIGPFSDGDRNHRPKSEWTIVSHPTLYLEKLAAQWMMARGESRYGVNYRLDRLPEGYRLYERPRPQNSKLIDKHLYGHPQHKFFDSPNRFYKHFEWLMNNRPEEKCPCTICGKGTPLSDNPKPPGSKITASHSGAAALAVNPRFVDEERTPDVFRRFIDKLQKLGTLNQDLYENMSMDWRAERGRLPKMLETLPMQRSWIPRVGEIVLFVRDLDGEICYDGNTKSYRIFNELEQQFVGLPKWEAGVIGQIPIESVHIQDVLQETPKTQNVTYSGFRVEPYPDPNGRDKRYTKQYKYVPLHQTRPFVFWQDMLRGTPESDWHPTITNALTIMSSLSLVEKYRFQGKWPQANVLCKGIFVGTELVCVGDAVRILPHPDANRVTDALHVQSIKLKVTNLDKASDNDNDEGHPYNSTVLLVGTAYTMSRSRAWDKTLLNIAQSQNLPSSMRGDQEWFHLHDPKSRYQISFTKVLGRCFEAETMQLCFPSDEEDVSPFSVLSRGLPGLRLGRAFSSQADRRIKDGKQWYWGDSRCEVLDIETLNSVEVSAHNQERDDDLLVGWRAVIRVLDKTADKEAFRQTTLVERPPAMAMSSSMGQAAFNEDEIISSVENQEGDNDDDDDDEEESAEEEEATNTELLRQFQTRNKRSRSVAEDDSSDSGSSGGAFHNMDKTMTLASMPKPIVVVPPFQTNDQPVAMRDGKRQK